ncbi:MAG TPA: response regulator [Kofleriaceae bacterium]
MWRVLLVDDSSLIRNAMHAALEPFGLELVQAENGAVAVDQALASRWDLIFLDVMMPVMDGPTALRRIREAGTTTPVVLVTSVSSARTVAAAFKLGGVSYIGKPFTPDQIRSVATKLLKLDPGALPAPPRVLLQHTDPELPGRLRTLLPSHVAIDTSQSVAESLGFVEQGRRDLVLFEARETVDERATIARILRRALPSAGIFAIGDHVAPGGPWQPDNELDGVVPRTFDENIVRGFLYPTFLLPLVVMRDQIAHAAGFRGTPAHLPAYVASLSRLLVERCVRGDQTADFQVDFTRLPHDTDTAVAVITGVDRELRQAGAAPVFRIPGAMHDAAGDRLTGVLLRRA